MGEVMRVDNQFVITELNRIIMVGKNEYPDKKISFSKNIEYNELIFHFSGHATVYFDDEILETRKNTIRFLPQGQVKRYDVDRYETGECIVAYFHTDQPVSQTAFVAELPQAEKIGHLFRKMFSTWVGKNNGYYFEAISLLYKIFCEMQKTNYIPQQHYLRIKPAIQEIHDRFLSEDLSIERLSHMCGVSDSYFQRLFKEKFGVSPKKYLIQLKINHACELLRLDQYTVTQISQLCGFSDVFFFSRQFKAYMGISPTQFVEKYKSSK